MPKNVSYTSFIDNYISKPDVDFAWQHTPLQVYALESIWNFLKTPTPLLQADYHFFIYLNEGNFTQQTSITTYHVKAPSILYVPSGEVFSIHAINSSLKGYYILIDQKVISSLIGKVEFSDLQSIETLTLLNTADSNWMDSICKLIFEEISSSTPNRKIGTGLLQAFLHKLVALNDGRKSLSRNEELANKFKQLVFKHYKSQKSVDFYASELGLSNNYLNRCVKSQFNKSCKQLIQETSILQSQVLMFESSLDISEIAFKVGFEDPSYFSRVFKKVTGQTPMHFQKQIKHDLS